MHTTNRTALGECALDARRFESRLIDLSLGGAAVKIDRTSPDAFKINELMFVSFHLPGETHDHIMLSRVRQVRRIGDTENLRLGVQFLTWPDERAFEREQDRLARFIAETQREKLRRAG